MGENEREGMRERRREGGREREGGKKGKRGGREKNAKSHLNASRLHTSWYLLKFTVRLAISTNIQSVRTARIVDVQ